MASIGLLVKMRNTFAVNKQGQAKEFFAVQQKYGTPLLILGVKPSRGQG